MKKRIWKKTGMLLLLLISLLCMQAVPANAKVPVPGIDSNFYVPIYNSNLHRSKMLYITNSSEGKAITGLKNSNPNVLSVDQTFSSGLYISVKKAGTSTITFKYGGKKLKTTVTVFNWKNPCSSFKVGNKEFKSKFNKSNGYNLNNQKKQWKTTVNIKAKSGWKLSKIQYVYNGVKTTVKNKSSITFKGNNTGSSIIAFFKQPKTGIEISVQLGYSMLDIPDMNVYL